MKIRPNIGKRFSRYLLKGTTNGRLTRNSDAVILTGCATIYKLVKFPMGLGQPQDLVHAAGFGTFFMVAFKNMCSAISDLKPIKKRAIKIKKAAKLAKMNINT